MKVIINLTVDMLPKSHRPLSPQPIKAQHNPLIDMGFYDSVPYLFKSSYSKHIYTRNDDK